MLKTFATISLLLIASGVSAQRAASGSGPQSAIPNRQVCKLLNRSLGADTFNFCGKRIAYAGLGSGGFLHQRHEPGLTSIEQNIEFGYRLLVLDSSEIRATGGYDAIVLRYFIGEKMKQQGLDRSEIVDAVYNTDALTTAEADSVRSESNIRFINRVLSRHMNRQIDIRETRLAVLQCTYGKKNHGITPLNYSQYRRILDDNLRGSSSDIGVPHWLNAGQKKASGGYDLIINVGESKKGMPMEALVTVVGKT